MSTYTQSVHHIVFATKNRQPCLLKQHRPALFQYIWGVIKNDNCHLYRINGMEDRLHIATHIHPSVSVANLVKDIKIGSSLFIKEKGIFPEFTGWQDGYGAFTYAYKDKGAVIDYIKHQEEHHNTKTFKEEYAELLLEHGVVFDEKYLM